MNRKISDKDEYLETENFFNYLIENSRTTAILILDTDGKIIHTSFGVKKSYGYDNSDLIGKNFSILYTEEDKLAKKPETELVLAKEQGFASDLNYVLHKDGSPIWTNGETILVKDSSGRTYFAKIILDINEEKILKEFLTDTERRHSVINHVLNSVEQGILLFKPVLENGDIVDFEYVLVNRYAEKLLGRNKEELTGKMWLQEYPNMRDMGIFNIQVQTFKTGTNRSIEFFYGHQKFNKWYKNTCIKAGQDLLLVTFDDITNLKLLNEQLEEKIEARTKELRHSNEELKQINEHLDKYAYVISHDLKAPLAAIEGLIPIIKKDYKEKPIDQEAEEMFGMISTKIQDMRSIIEEVLKSAKQEKRSKGYITFYDLVHEIIETLNPPKHFHILIQYSLPVIKYNRIALMQIMQNLLSNAIKYMNKPQPLIQITCEEYDNYYLICVVDNGSGIPENQLPNIFEVFESCNTNEKIESHGIGLSIVKQLVEENGGKIWVESKLGEGAKFHFTIPK